MKLAILGAGISGLSAAWFLRNTFPDLEIFEQQTKVGGVIGTLKKEDFLFELGPRGFRQQEAIFQLVNELGLQHRLIPADASAKKRYIYLNQRLHLVNFSFLLSHGLFEGLLRDLTMQSSSSEDETVYEFFKRRFNKKIAESLIDPLTKGIFAGDCRTLSMRSCFPALWNIDQQGRSLTRSLLFRKKAKGAALYTFQEGMQELPQRLAEAINCSIHLGCEIGSLDQIQADRIIAAIPTKALARLTGIEDPLHYSKIAVVHFGWNEKVLTKQGFGFLVASPKRSALLGMSFDSDIFPSQNKGDQTRITVMLDAKLVEHPYEAAITALKEILHITQPPFISHHYNAELPQYSLDHHKKLEHFKKQLPSNVYPLGNCYEGMSVNDCIVSAMRVQEKIR